MASGTKVKLWYVEDCPHSRKYCRIPQSRNPEKKDFVFVPLVLIEHTTKQPIEPGEWAVHVVTLPDWFVQKQNL